MHKITTFTLEGQENFAALSFLVFATRAAEDATPPVPGY